MLVAEELLLLLQPFFFRLEVRDTVFIRMTLLVEADEGVLSTALHLELDALDTRDCPRDPQVDVTRDLAAGLVVGLIQHDLDVTIVKVTILVLKQTHFKYK